MWRSRAGSIISLAPCQGQWKGDTGEVILLSKLFRDVIKLLRAVSGASGHRHLVLICSAPCPNSLAWWQKLQGAERGAGAGGAPHKFFNLRPSTSSCLRGWGAVRVLGSCWRCPGQAGHWGLGQFKVPSQLDQSGILWLALDIGKEISSGFI